MKISTLINYAGGFKEAVAEIKELEQAGLDVVWVPEAYSFDAPSAMGYLAAQTQSIHCIRNIADIQPHPKPSGHDRSRHRLPVRWSSHARSWRFGAAGY